MCDAIDIGKNALKVFPMNRSIFNIAQHDLKIYRYMESQITPENVR